MMSRKRNHNVTAAKRKARKVESNRQITAAAAKVAPVMAYTARDPLDRKPSARGGFATDGNVGLNGRWYGAGSRGGFYVVTDARTRMWIDERVKRPEGLIYTIGQAKHDTSIL